MRCTEYKIGCYRFQNGSLALIAVDSAYSREEKVEIVESSLAFSDAVKVTYTDSNYNLVLQQYRMVNGKVCLVGVEIIG